MENSLKPSNLYFEKICKNNHISLSNNVILEYFYLYQCTHTQHWFIAKSYFFEIWILEQKLWHPKHLAQNFYLLTSNISSQILALFFFFLPSSAIPQLLLQHWLVLFSAGNLLWGGICSEMENTWVGRTALGLTAEWKVLVSPHTVRVQMTTSQDLCATLEKL